MMPLVDGETMSLGVCFTCSIVHIVLFWGDMGNQSGLKVNWLRGLHEI